MSTNDRERALMLVGVSRVTTVDEVKSLSSLDDVFTFHLHVSEFHFISFMLVECSEEMKTFSNSRHNVVCMYGCAEALNGGADSSNSNKSPISTRWRRHEQELTLLHFHFILSRHSFHIFLLLIFLS